MGAGCRRGAGPRLRVRAGAAGLRHAGAAGSAGGQPGHDPRMDRPPRSRPRMQPPAVRAGRQGRRAGPPAQHLPLAVDRLAAGGRFDSPRGTHSAASPHRTRRAANRPAATGPPGSRQPAVPGSLCDAGLLPVGPRAAREWRLFRAPSPVSHRDPTAVRAGHSPCDPPGRVRDCLPPPHGRSSAGPPALRRPNPHFGRPRVSAGRSPAAGSLEGVGPHRGAAFEAVRSLERGGGDAGARLPQRRVSRARRAQPLGTGGHHGRLAGECGLPAGPAGGAGDQRPRCGRPHPRRGLHGGVSHPDARPPGRRGDRPQRPAATGHRPDTAGAGAVHPHPGNAGPRGTDRWTDTRPVAGRGGQPTPAQCHGGRRGARRLRADRAGPGRTGPPGLHRGRHPCAARRTDQPCGRQPTAGRRRRGLAPAR